MPDITWEWVERVAGAENVQDLPYVIVNVTGEEFRVDNPNL